MATNTQNQKQQQQQQSQQKDKSNFAKDPQRSSESSVDKNRPSSQQEGRSNMNERDQSQRNR